MEWQPIETAPKDGTPVLLGVWVFGPDMASAAWNGEFWDMQYLGDEIADIFEDEKYDREFVDPTHWMPLPPPPEAG